MAYLGVAGFASTVGLALFALFNVVFQAGYSPHVPVETAAITKAVKVDEVSALVASPKSPNIIKVAEATGPQYIDPPVRTAKEQTGVEQAVADLKQSVAKMDHERARYHPLHFKPNIAKASNEECLVCHSEIMTRKPRQTSPAGVKADDVLAWYQTLDTYSGKQQSFHFRHLNSDFAKQVMNLSCNFCHKGNDPREETPDMQPGQKVFSTSAKPNFTLRKMVNPSTTCLRCHGKFPVEVMEGVEGTWPKARVDLEDEETPNGCLTCHEESFRPNRHHVSYLKAASIEKLAKKSSDVCYGCHGGRQWYRTSYPYPRHPWPDMDEETPEWAKNRPTKSEPHYQLKTRAVK